MGPCWNYMNRAPRAGAGRNPQRDTDAIEEVAPKRKKSISVALNAEQHLYLDQLAETLGPSWDRRSVHPNLERANFPGLTTKQLAARIRAHFQVVAQELRTSISPSIHSHSQRKFHST